MYDKQIIYQLIDNKYNSNKIDIPLNHIDINDFNNYINSLCNALKYNYKKYNKIITEILIRYYPYGHYYIDDYELPINFINYLNLNDKLTNITINQSLINDNNLKILCSSLKNKTNLKKLDLSYNNISDLTPLKFILKNNTHLKILNLLHNDINDITPLNDILKNNTHLKILNLYENHITDLTQLNIILKNNKFLQELYIDNPYCIYSYKDNNKIIPYNDGNILTFCGYGLFSINQQYDNNNTNNYHYDLSNIFNILKTNNTLKKLDLNQFILNNSEYYSLCDMLKVNTSINYLHITNTTNKSTEFNHDCSELFNVLKFNGSIQELKINIYKMNKKEIKSLSEMLKYNSSIKKLIIIKNYTSYNDWFLIYKSLEFNKNIKELTLINTIQTTTETDRRYDLNLLCKSLYFNKSITIIEIDDIIIKDVDLIVNLLKYNHHIKNIYFCDYQISGFFDYNIIGRSLVNNLKDKMNKILSFNKTLYNDF